MCIAEFSGNWCAICLDSFKPSTVFLIPCTFCKSSHRIKSLLLILLFTKQAAQHIAVGIACRLVGIPASVCPWRPIIAKVISRPVRSCELLSKFEKRIPDLLQEFFIFCCIQLIFSIHVIRLLLIYCVFLWSSRLSQCLDTADCLFKYTTARLIHHLHLAI